MCLRRESKLTPIRLSDLCLRGWQLRKTEIRLAQGSRSMSFGQSDGNGLPFLCRRGVAIRNGMWQVNTQSCPFPWCQCNSQFQEWFGWPLSRAVAISVDDSRAEIRPGRRHSSAAGTNNA